MSYMRQSFLFVSRIEFIGSRLSSISAHVSGVSLYPSDRPPSPCGPERATAGAARRPCMSVRPLHSLPAAAPAPPSPPLQPTLHRHHRRRPPPRHCSASPARGRFLSLRLSVVGAAENSSTLIVSALAFSGRPTSVNTIMKLSADSLLMTTAVLLLLMSLSSSAATQELRRSPCGHKGWYDSNQKCCIIKGCRKKCPLGHECLQLPRSCAAPRDQGPSCDCPTRYGCRPSSSSECGLNGLYDSDQECCSIVGCKEDCSYGYQCLQLPPTSCAAPHDQGPSCDCPSRYGCVSILSSECGLHGFYDGDLGCCVAVGCKECPPGQECQEVPTTSCADPSSICDCPIRFECMPKGDA